ncbi:hypothetical protein [Desulfovibrio sp. JC010]|uniref:hypothetical protein n=1 Tax=Desulfovibrio sp. JC010 TaxID=2593641 RepID=UPI0013D02F45|nr:hypothetical protein [Desulfovibrio sp. JC010]NDV27615.1 hypothetical protein [Desulfovibrio sp. JC010]
MALYLIIAIGICIYSIHRRSMSVGGSVVSGLIWPVTFALYLYTVVTGRPTRNPITGITSSSSGRGWSQRGRQGRGRGRGRH